MKKASKQWVGALVVVGALAPVIAEAGVQSYSAGCSKAADGSGWCMGNFQSFRTHSDPNTYASFVEHATGTRLFQAWWPGIGLVSCVPNATVAGLWPRVMSHEGFFNVSWDATGTCTALILNNGSHHSTF
jgi:hypothetical protein